MKSVFSIIILSILCSACLATDAPENLFLWQESNALMASAKTPEDYLIAAQAYKNLLDKGIHNGPLYYNIGTALLHAGKYNEAITALLRAERYLGSAGDICRNLKIARTRKAGLKSIGQPWYRIIFFWHFKLSASTRMAISLIAFSLFWLILSFRVLGVSRGIKSLAILTFLAFAIFSTSTIISYHQEGSQKGRISVVK